MPGDLGSSFGGIGFDVEANDLFSDVLDEAAANVREFADKTHEQLQQVSDDAETTGAEFENIGMSTRKMGYEIREGTMGMMHIGHSFLLLSNYAHQLGGDFTAVATVTGELGAVFTSLGTAGYSLYGVQHVLSFLQGPLAAGFLEEAAAAMTLYGAEIALSGGLIVLAGLFAAYIYSASSATTATVQLTAAQKAHVAEMDAEKKTAEDLNSYYADMATMKQQIIDLTLQEADAELNLEDAKLAVIDAEDNYNSKLARQQEIEAALADPRQVEMKKIAHEKHMKLADVQKELQRELGGAQRDTEKAHIAVERAQNRVLSTEGEITKLKNQQAADSDQIAKDMNLIGMANLRMLADAQANKGAMLPFWTWAWNTLGWAKEMVLGAPSEEVAPSPLPGAGGLGAGATPTKGGVPGAGTEKPSAKFAMYVNTLIAPNLNKDQVDAFIDQQSAQMVSTTKSRGVPTNTGGG